MSRSPFQRAWWIGFSLFSLQPLLSRSLRVMLPLVSEITEDPRKIPRSKADHTIARLPIQQVAIGDTMLDVMGTGSFHLAYPVADEQRWWHAHDQMHVVRKYPQFGGSTLRVFEARAPLGSRAEASQWNPPGRARCLLCATRNEG
jgi:hypothetical protein